MPNYSAATPRIAPKRPLPNWSSVASIWCMAWRYGRSQFAAADAVRSERRRREREQESFMMNQTPSDQPGNVDGEKLRPVLDQVLGELDEEDRDAVALRFFEQRSFADVAQALQ